MSEITLAGCQLNNLTGCICTNSTLQMQLSDCVLGSCNLTEQIRSFPASHPISNHISDVGFTGSSTILQEQLCKGIPQPSRGAEIRRISIILTVLASFAVTLRCASRYLVARKFWWDDWVIILAAVSLPAKGF